MAQGRFRKALTCWRAETERRSRLGEIGFRQAQDLALEPVANGRSACLNRPRIGLVAGGFVAHSEHMATVVAPTVRTEEPTPSAGERSLEPGDRLSRDEFEWRYDRMPHLKKAELIEGIVYMPSPLRAQKHGHPQSLLALWLATYEMETPGVRCFDNATVRLDL